MFQCPQCRADKAHLLPIEDLQQMQRGLLDINNLLAAACKDLSGENEALKRRLDEARSHRGRKA